MSKKLFDWMLMATVVLGLSLSFTACSDDDDKNASEQKKDDVDPLDTDDARVAFRWLCALANSEGFDKNWQSKTWEPEVGQASENDKFTRVIVVNDLDEAKEQFSKLADVNVSLLGTTQTVNGGAAGTMKWIPSAAGAQNLAVVEVSSRIMPHLQKLVYCTQEQTGLNSAMAGTAYYRFGDVVVDNEGYYWVCVRPSFAPKKGDSHWINIYNASNSGNKPEVEMGESPKHPMHEEYIYDKYNEKEKYKNVTILLPTKLPYDREHIYNLSNLVWAMLNPQKYWETALANKSVGLGGFSLDLNGRRFVEAVSKFWDQKPEGYKHTIWEMIFGLNKESMKSLQEMNFFYQGYKWWWGETPDFWIYKSKGYVNTLKETGSESDDKVTNINVVTSGFDIRRYAGDAEASKAAGFEQHYVTNEQAQPIKGYWVVRYKRGDQLCVSGSKYDPYNKLSACKDIYTFNGKTGYEVGANIEQEMDGEINVKEDKVLPDVGDVIGENGKFYKTEQIAENEGTHIVARVVCVNNATPVEAGTDYYGLAVALEDLMNGEFFPWGDQDSRDINCASETGIVALDQPARLPDVMNGLAVTTRMATKACNASHNHAAAFDIYDMDHAITDNQEKAKFSRWFIPSIGQAILACKNMGSTWNGTQLTGVSDWKWGEVLSWTNMAVIENWHMTCTAYSDQAPGFYVFSEDATGTSAMTKEVSVRPFLAFKKIQ